MKVLIDFAGPPFFLAHGGATTQVVETVGALQRAGVEVEYCRWWDSSQKGDLIHSFGVPRRDFLTFAKSKHIPVCNTTLFTATCNRSPLHLKLQGLMISALKKIPAIPPWNSIRPQLVWDNYAQCDLNLVGLKAEAEVLRKVLAVPEAQIGIVPLGLSQTFLDAGPGSRSNPYLITTGTITERKRSLELARMALETKVPILFVGKPYDEKSDYWKEFQSLIDDTYVLHKRHTESVTEMVELLQSSRGYVLYSDYENWCLSAHEAIACGQPLLIPDQPWSRELFAAKVEYFSPGDRGKHPEILRKFYDAAPMLQVPDIHLFSWDDVASQLIAQFRRICAA